MKAMLGLRAALALVLCQVTFGQQQDPCICRKSWTSPDEDYVPHDVQGCFSDPFTKRDWCYVTNPGCATEEDGDIWTYCDANTPVAQDDPDECVCLHTWSAVEVGCDSGVNGCPAQPCDAGLADPAPFADSWCMVANPGCRTDVDLGGWTLCDANTPVEPDTEAPGDCSCAVSWTDSSVDNGLCDAAMGCPSQACDGDDDRWCQIEPTTKGCATDIEGSGWSYCDDNTMVGPLIQEPTGPPTSEPTDGQIDWCNQWNKDNPFEAGNTCPKKKHCMFHPSMKPKMCVTEPGFDPGPRLPTNTPPDDGPTAAPVDAPTGGPQTSGSDLVCAPLPNVVKCNKVSTCSWFVEPGAATKDGQCCTSNLCPKLCSDEFTDQLCAEYIDGSPGLVFDGNMKSFSDALDVAAADCCRPKPYDCSGPTKMFKCTKLSAEGCVWAPWAKQAGYANSECVFMDGLPPDDCKYIKKKFQCGKDDDDKCRWATDGTESCVEVIRHGGWKSFCPTIPDKPTCVNSPCTWKMNPKAKGAVDDKATPAPTVAGPTGKCEEYQDCSAWNSAPTGCNQRAHCTHYAHHEEHGKDQCIPMDHSPDELICEGASVKNCIKMRKLHLCDAPCVVATWRQVHKKKACYSVDFIPDVPDCNQWSNDKQLCDCYGHTGQDANGKDLCKSKVCKFMKKTKKNPAICEQHPTNRKKRKNPPCSNLGANCCPSDAPTEPPSV